MSRRIAKLSKPLCVIPTANLPQRDSAAAARYRMLRSARHPTPRLFDEERRMRRREPILGLLLKSTHRDCKGERVLTSECADSTLSRGRSRS